MAVRIDMKTMLSIPSTISIAVSVTRLARIAGSVIHSMKDMRLAIRRWSGGMSARELQEDADQSEVDVDDGEQRQDDRVRI